MNIRKTLRSFRFAGRGMLALFRYENNARVHLLVAALVVAVGAWLGLNRFEWALIITQIGIVWAAEAVNTAIEKLCDVVSPEHHPGIGAAKDIAAGAVLIAAGTAVLVGIIILGGRALEVFFATGLPVR